MSSLHKILACIHGPQYTSRLDREVIYKILMGEAANLKSITVFYEEEEDAASAVAKLWSEFPTKRNGKQCECEGFTISFIVADRAFRPIVDFDTLDISRLSLLEICRLRKRHEGKQCRLLPELSKTMVGYAFEPSLDLRVAVTSYLDNGWTICDQNGVKLQFRSGDSSGADLGKAKFWSCFPAATSEKPLAPPPTTEKKKTMSIRVGDSYFVLDVTREVDEKEIIASLALVAKCMVQ